MKLPPPVLREVLLTPELPVAVLDQVFFQSGDNGVHQWESGIVLARYLILNSELFAGRRVLELGCGCGLTAIAACKYMGSPQYFATDYNQKVLTNADENAQRNGCRLQLARMDWCDPATFLTQKFDFVIGSDLIYDGAPLQDLARTVRHHLAPGGKMLLIMPVKRHMTQSFIETMAAEGFRHEDELLEAEAYRAPASADGHRDFPELKTHAFRLHTFS